jgi:hypothetical protein
MSCVSPLLVLLSNLLLGLFLGNKKASLVGGLGTRGESRCAYLTTTTTFELRVAVAFIVNTTFSVSAQTPFGNRTISFSSF